MLIHKLSATMVNYDQAEEELHACSVFVDLGTKAQQSKFKKSIKTIKILKE